MENSWGNKSKWKILFFSLVGINVILLVAIASLLLWPTSSQDIPKKEYIENHDGAEFIITSSKQNLTELVNNYVNKLMQDNADRYSVQFNDENVQLNGAIEAFDTEIPIKVTLEPVVQENGDLILEQKEMSLGLLHLPNKRVLEYLRDHLPTPEWVIINPDKENIYVAVTQMEIKSNFKVRVQQFDLANDQISFRIKVPNETLGL